MFRRVISKDNFYYIGWWKGNSYHGYGKKVYFDSKEETKEGLWEDHVFKPKGDVNYIKLLKYALKFDE